MRSKTIKINTKPQINTAIFEAQILDNKVTIPKERCSYNPKIAAENLIEEYKLRILGKGVIF